MAAHLGLPARCLWVAALLAAAALAAITTPSAVLGSCIMPPPVQEAIQTSEIVFVGTVVETANGNTWANVEVEEVWRGPDQPQRVVVKGGPGGNAMTSVDRSFEVGVKYLFFPFAGENGELADNSCSNTVPWSADLAQARPTDARPPLGATPAAAGFDVGGLIAPLGVALLVGAVLLIAGVLARGRTA
jgi:hypothetical protein